jgi:hypothetical protein
MLVLTPIMPLGYGHDANQAYRMDFAEFELPGAGDEPEDYIVWYYWQSYRDIIDVQYLGAAPPVENIYGTKSSTTVWEKVCVSRSFVTIIDQKQCFFFVLTLCYP